MGESNTAKYNSDYPSCRILVVDDHEVTRQLFQEVLGPDHYQIDEAASGEEALHIYAQRRPDIILLDADMPGMDGFEVCRRIQEMPGGDRTPILIVTALGLDQAEIDKAFAAGAADYITKPIHWPILRHRIRYLARMKAAEQARYKLAQVIEQSPSLVTIADAAGNIEYVNPAFLAAIGYRMREDITERKLADQALQRYAAELELRNRELDSYNYTIAHDLKNPLAAALSFIEIVSSAYGDQLSPEAAGLMGKIEAIC